MMRMGAAFLASAIILTTALAAPAEAQQTDWTTRVTQSKMGGHVLGNPLAKHKLVEYVSYTCNHCASFTVDSNVPLKSNHLAKGHVSSEVRNYVRDPVDFTAALLARCGGRAKFFGNHRAFMSTQGQWLRKVTTATRETRESWYTGELDTRLRKIASDVGFYDLIAKRGINRTQANACLANTDSQNKILAMTRHGQDEVKITGTPSFTLDGKLLPRVHSWTSLRPILAGLPRN